MRLLLAIIALSLVAASPALDAEYLTIVGAESPTSDVITAANFAATIKQAGITFTGATDKDALEGYEQDDLDDHYFVVIDGNTILLLGEQNQLVENYFEDQGFSVETKTQAELEDLAVTEDYQDYVVQEPEEAEQEVEQETPEQPEQEAPPENEQETPEEPVCTGCEFEGLCYEEGDIVFKDGGAQYCDGSELQPKKQLYDECTQDYECAASIACSDGTCGEKQGFVSRVINWFASFF